MTTAVLLSLGLLAGSFGLSRADDEKIKVEDLPKAVSDAVKAKFPAAKLTKAEKEVEDGKTSYEVTVEDAGKKADVVVSPEGKLLAIEKKIDAARLPEAVTAAVKAKYPTASVKGAEEVVEFKAGGEETVYEVKLALEDKKEVELEISPKGKILEEERED
ncbi:PepSY-like domain-containing protein [Aquisphaera insulae]|uniref:PepSY-like domain-containing protein n=1 Tax=Aquisphaera insulae TaxID=2712864 RepID=UPI0013ECFCB7|nr:PepSY-like domain-containing protein [Aquisphaera insulae]